MTMIGDKAVSYKFGPQYDLDIQFSATLENQIGIPYDECRNASRLLLQLLCHAVQQLQSVEKKCWTLEKIEEIGSWEYPDKKSYFRAQVCSYNTSNDVCKVSDQSRWQSGSNVKREF